MCHKLRHPLQVSCQPQRPTSALGYIPDRPAWLSAPMPDQRRQEFKRVGGKSLGNNFIYSAPPQSFYAVIPCAWN